MKLSDTKARIFGARSWFLFPLTYLLITAAFGVLLRILQLEDLGFNFLYVLHAHSHLALLGWCHTALFLLLVNAFIPASDSAKKSYQRIFWLFQLTVIGMLLFFPFQGYSPTTITFSSLFLIVGYVFAWRFLKDLKKEDVSFARFSVRFARIAVVFFILSSFGPWALGPLNANGLGGSEIYFNTIYFYLHFLYNGWFLFALLALCFRYLERKKFSVKPRHASFVLRYLTLSTVLGYTLSTLWIDPPEWVYDIAILAVILQLMAVIYMLRIGIQLYTPLIEMRNSWIKVLLIASLFFFTIKVSLQTLSALPYWAQLIGGIRDWVLTYLHLVFLGCLTPFLLIFIYRELMGFDIGRIGKMGIISFFLGFILHEALMFYRGLAFWQKWMLLSNTREYLLYTTILILIALGMIVKDLVRKRMPSRNTSS